MLAAFLLGLPRLPEFVIHEGKFQLVSGKITDRGYFFEYLLKSFFLKPAERIQLYFDQVRNFQNLG
jgi:hypothetical protein